MQVLTRSICELLDWHLLHLDAALFAAQFFMEMLEKACVWGC
jgi:hypothetical protein